MSRFIGFVGLLFALVASVAIAQTKNGWPHVALQPMGWTSVSYNNDVALFYKPPVIRLSGQLPRLWIRFEFKSAQEERTATANPRLFRSQEILDEFDCAHGRFRVIQSSEFENNNLVGTPNQQSTALSDWMFAPPASFNDMLQKIVCSKGQQH